MNPLKITSTQPTSVTPADSSSAASDSGSDFGPILRAASATPAGATKSDATGTPVPDPTSSVKPDRTGRRGGRDSASSAQPQADATAAACAAAAAAVPGRAESAPTDASLATGNATRDAPALAPDAGSAAGDPTGASSPIAKARAVALSDATPAAQAALSGAAASALRSPADANSSTPIEAHRVVTLQAPRIDAAATPLDQAGASASQAAAATPDQSTDAQGADDRSDDDGGADSQADAGFASLVPASMLPTGAATQAAAHALSAQIQQAVPQAAGGSAPHAGNVAASLLTNDPSGNLASAASGTGAFGSVTAYPAEGRAAVATPVGQPGFGQELSERVVLLTRSGVQSAQISLEPTGLGPVGVSIQVHGHAASLVFTAQHEATRNALEAELPRLREMFAASGMQLSDASVGGRAQPDWSAPNHSPTSGKAPGGGDADPVAAGLAEPATTAGALAVPRLVDTYA